MTAAVQVDDCLAGVPRCAECDGQGTVDWNGYDEPCRDCDGTGEAP